MLDLTNPAAVAVGGNREVWLWPGTAADPAWAGWHDTLGPTGAPQWSWTARPAGAGLPAFATWNGTRVALDPQGSYATVVVTGDGNLVFDGGGTLAIARGLPGAQVTVRIYGG